MLKVVVDATPITKKPSGVGLYVANLINYLAQEKTVELGIFYQPTLQKWLQRDLSLPDFLEKERSQSSVVFPFPVRLSNWVLNNTPRLFPYLLDSSLQSYDLFHGTNFSVYPDRHTRKVMTLYDLTFLRYPQYIDRVVARYNQKVRKCLQWTDTVVAISESTKEEAVKYLGIDPQKIWVTPLASRYSRDYLAGIDTNALQQQVTYDFSQPYLLFVSTIEPRKNIVTLIEAFNHLKKQRRIEHNLVLIGGKGWRYEPIFEAIVRSPYSKDIYHLDYLSDDLVALFYKLATAFVYPSFYEGFGLPVLEAMTLGTPVVCANTSSLPEVAGDAAIFVDPHQPLELAEAIYQIVNSSLLRDRLIQQGYQQSAKFSWATTAQKTVEAYLNERSRKEE